LIPDARDFERHEKGRVLELVSFGVSGWAGGEKTRRCGTSFRLFVV